MIWAELTLCVGLVVAAAFSCIYDLRSGPDLNRKLDATTTTPPPTEKVIAVVQVADDVLWNTSLLSLTP